MGLKINGSTSGSIEIDVPAVAGTDTSITIPAKNGGTFIVEESTGNIDLGPLDINGSASDDSVVIDGSGRLLVGTSTTRGVFAGSYNSQIQAEGSGSGAGRGSLSVINNAVGDHPSFIVIGKSNTNTIGGTTLVSANQWLGTIDFQGTDGSDLRSAASIRCYVDGTPGSADMPGRLAFCTTKDGVTTSTERMRIAQEGQTRIFSDDDAFHAQTGRAAGGTYAVIYGRHSATGTVSGTASFVVYSNGNTVNTNNVYGSLSDIKLKENIVDAGSQWDDLKAIQVRKYNFKAETNQQTHTQLGVIAQEVELVSPGLVTESPDRDDEGNDLGTTTKSVNYSVLYIKAVKALQEAMERIENLETANASLEARLTALEGGAS